MRALLSSGTRFLLIGVLSTVIELTFFNIFLVTLHWDPVAAKIVSSLIALVSAYLGNREWAFRDRRSRSRASEMGLFVAVNAVCTGFGAFLVWLGTQIVGDGTLALINLVNVVSIAVVVVLRFTLYRGVVFRAPRAEKADPVSASHDGGVA